MNTEITLNDNSYLDTKIGRFHKDPSVTTVYVGNLSFTKTEEEIRDLFEEYTDVNYVKIVKDHTTHKSKGIAFIQMVNRKEAMYAISQLNGSQVDGRTLKVSIANENDDARAKVVKKRRKPYRPYVSKKDRGEI